MIKEQGRDIQRGKNGLLGNVVFGWQASRTLLFGLAQSDNGGQSKCLQHGTWGKASWQGKINDKW